MLSTLISQTQSTSDLQLRELQPRPIQTRRDETTSAGSSNHVGLPVDMQGAHLTSLSAGSRDSSGGSDSKRKPEVLFSGPPPPIAASVTHIRSPLSSSSQHSDRERFGLVRTVGESISHLILSHPTRGSSMYKQRSDPVWRGLQRRERSLEVSIQQLLDSQAEGLVSVGQPDEVASGNYVDSHSDAGSTPTGTFYSTATSKSQMSRSLYAPPQSTLDGNVMPVRQPAKSRSLGLQSARHGIDRAMSSLVELRRDETEYIDEAIEVRKVALEQLSTLSSRRLGIQSEMAALDDDDEPLRRELQELEEKWSSVDREMNELERKLAGLRDQQRWLHEAIEDVRGKRAAGLSGYKGALHAVDSELSMLVRQPPVLPLDPIVQRKVVDTADGEVLSSGGVEFLSLKPQRRTPDMAKTWWETEVNLLERRKTQISNDRIAAEEGRAVWNEVVKAVFDFESGFRRIIKFHALSGSPEEFDSSQPGKETLRRQMEKMGGILSQLEQAMELAESKRWNLLICAIGAELEAFKEAYYMLKELLPDADPDPQHAGETRPIRDEMEALVAVHNGERASKDPLVLHVDDDANQDVTGATLLGGEPDGIPLESDAQRHSQDGENEVPLEFLAEHS